MENINEYQQVRNAVEKHPYKTQFFQEMLLNYLPEMRLAIRGGHLTKVEGWRNILEHQAVEIVAMDIFCDLLGVESKSKKKLMSAVAYHDWNKRLELGKINEDQINVEQTKSYLEILHPDQQLLDAVEPGFLHELENNQPNLLQLAMFYIDDITFESTIMPMKDRLINSKDRNPDWERELKLGKYVESQLFDIIKKRDVPVATPSDIPTLILKGIQEKMDSLLIPK